MVIFRFFPGSVDAKARALDVDQSQYIVALEKEVLELKSELKNNLKQVEEDAVTLQELRLVEFKNMHTIIKMKGQMKYLLELAKKQQQHEQCTSDETSDTTSSGDEQ